MSLLLLAVTDSNHELDKIFDDVALGYQVTLLTKDLS